MMKLVLSVGVQVPPFSMFPSQEGPEGLPLFRILSL